MIKVLFVCLGNICRSPTAEGVFRRLVETSGLGDRIAVDSAGTHAYHIDEPPDARAQAAARRRGVDLSALRGRQATARDLVEHDYVLAMDHENLANLRRICPLGHEHKLRLLMSFAPAWGEDEVPDPYFGGANGFDRVLDMVEDACDALLADIRRRHLSERGSA